MASEPLLYLPKRPRVIGVARRTVGALQKVGLAKPELNADKLVTTAMAKARHDDLGSTAAYESLEILCRSMTTEADLSPIGHLMVHRDLQAALIHRLRMRRHIAENPSILDTPVTKPVVVMGLPRTGTTLLQRVLGADPQARSLQLWEAFRPTPAPTASTYATDKRRRISKGEMRFADLASPDVKKIHPMAADWPEECMFVMKVTMRTLAYPVSFNVPTYLDHLTSIDMTEAYAELATTYQYLQHKHGKHHWVLKAPQHLWWVGAMRKAFPDALFVQTHRDPLKVLPSMASLLAASRIMGSEHVDRRDIGAQLAPLLAEGLRRSAADRPIGDRRFIDVQYTDLLADPMRVIRSLYDAAGFDLTNEAERAMEDFRRVHTKDRHGAHHYSCADFGLDPRTEEARFAGYRERFSVAAEAAPARVAA